MPAELLNDLNGQVVTGLAQAAGAIALCLAVIALCRWYSVRAEREAVLSIARGLVQMVFVGVVLALLLHGGLGIGVGILLLMTVAAGWTASRRLREIKGALMLSCIAIGAGAGTVIAAMLATGALQTDIAVLVPVGSMIIANAMNACAQAAERFRSDVRAHVGEVEASLLPRLDMLKSLGLVWIPGVMAGMVVSGASPVYAGIYQFVVVAMILAASGIAGLIISLLMRSRAFSPAAQLLLRPKQS